MPNDGGTGAPATGTDGGTTTTDPGTGGGTSTGTTDTGRNGTGTDGFDAAAWSELAKEYGTPDKVRERLGHARTWEDRAKANKSAADQVPTLQQQLDEFSQQMAQRDERDVERAGKTAIAQLMGQLGQAGVKWDDVEAELRPDPVRLLKDGEPDDELIVRYAKALAKHAGRPTPDPDQGRKGGDAPTDMNVLIRRAAGRI